MKFLALLAASACAFFGATQAQTVATTPAPSTTLPACVPLNFTEKKADIGSLNAVIDTAIQLNLLSKLLVNLDPITVADNRLGAIPFSILGNDFELTPIIKKLNATGVATLVPQHLNITNDTTLAIAIDFLGTLAVDGTFSFEIAQVNKQWWQLCWTNLLKPAECPPLAIDVDVGVALEKPSVAFNVSLGMEMCPKTAPKGTCSEVTVSTILIAALNNQFTTLLPRILKKITYASIETLHLSVDKLQRLAFHFPTSGPLITALGKQLLGYTTDEINKKGSLYNDVIAIVNSLGKTLINRLIGEDLAPMFGKTCY